MRNEVLAAIHSQQSEHRWRFWNIIKNSISCKQFFSNKIMWLGPCLPGHHYTPAEYALQRQLQFFGHWLSLFEEQLSTDIYWVVFLFCKHENIGFLVLWYLNTGALPFEEFSEDWLIVGEAWSLFSLLMLLETVQFSRSCKMPARGSISGRSEDRHIHLIGGCTSFNIDCIDSWD